MATKIPPHNLTEIAGAVHLHVNRIIEEGEANTGMPQISIEGTWSIQRSDFPTGASIHGIDGILICTVLKREILRALKCDVLDDSKGKRIIVHEIPTK